MLDKSSKLFFDMYIEHLQVWEESIMRDTFLPDLFNIGVTLDSDHSLDDTILSPEFTHLIAEVFPDLVVTSMIVKGFFLELIKQRV